MRYQVIRRAISSAPPLTDNNALNNAIAAANDGEFNSFTISNSVSLDPSGLGNASFSYSYQLNYDPINKRLYNWGGCHGIFALNVQRTFLAQYNVQANNFTNPIDPVPNGISSTDGGGTHGFNMSGVDFNTGAVYGNIAYFHPDTLMRRSAAGVWTTSTLPSPPRVNSTNGVAYHHTLYSGRGGLIWVLDGGIWSIDHRTDLGGSGNGQFILDRYNSPNGFLDAMGDAGTVHAWNYTDNCLYVGGGTGNKLYKISGSGAGTVTQIATPPIQAYVWDDSNNTGVLASSGRGGFLKLIQRDGACYEYNHTNNTWSGQIATLAGGILATTSHEIALGAIPQSGSDYGAIVFFLRTSLLNTSTTGWIWRV